MRTNNNNDFPPRRGGTRNKENNMKALEKEMLWRNMMKEQRQARREALRDEAEAEAARWRTEAERRQARIDNAVTRGLGVLPKPRRFRGYTTDEVHNAVIAAARAAV